MSQQEVPISVQARSNLSAMYLRQIKGNAPKSLYSNLSIFEDFPHVAPTADSLPHDVQSRLDINRSAWRLEKDLIQSKRLRSGSLELMKIGQYKSFWDSLDMDMGILLDGWERANKNLPEQIHVRSTVGIEKALFFKELAQDAREHADRAFSGEKLDKEVIDASRKALQLSIDSSFATTKFYSMDPDVRRELLRDCVSSAISLFQLDIATQSNEEINIETLVQNLRKLGRDWETKSYFKLSGNQENILHVSRILDVVSSPEESSDHSTFVHLDNDTRVFLSASLDQFIIENLNYTLEREEISLISQRQCQKAFQVAQIENERGHIDSSRQWFEIGFKNLKDSQKLPTLENMQDYIVFFENANKHIPKDEQLLFAGFTIFFHLRPTFSQMRKEEAIALAHEIFKLKDTVLNDTDLKEDDPGKHYARAIVIALNDPDSGIEILSRLEHKYDGIPFQNREMKRMRQIAQFLHKGYKDHQEEDKNTARRHLDMVLLAGSYRAMEEVIRRLEISGSPWASEIATKGALLHMLVRDPVIDSGHLLHQFKTEFSVQPSDRQVPFLIRREPQSNAFDTQIRLIDGDKLVVTSIADLFNNSRHTILANHTVNQVNAVAFIPAVDRPDALQPDFYIHLTTKGPALTLVINEGQIVGSFITTSINPHIPICAPRGQNDSTLWKPQLIDLLPAGERSRENTGDGFQIISVPISLIADGGGNALEPSGPPKRSLAIQNTSPDFILKDRLDMAIWNGIIAYIIQKPIEVDLTVLSLDNLFAARGSEFVATRHLNYNLPTIQSARAVIGDTGGSSYGIFADKYSVREDESITYLNIRIQAVSNAEKVLISDKVL